MSKYEVHALSCPKCGHVQDVDVYVSVNLTDNPDAADQIINGTWGDMVCKKCGYMTNVESRLHYSDINNKHWLIQYPRDQRMDFLNIEREALMVFHEEYEERAPEMIKKLAPDICKRICFGIREMAEKLLLWRHGIDDILLECFKMGYVREHLSDLFAVGPFEIFLIGHQNGTLNFVVADLDTLQPLADFSAQLEDVLQVKAMLNDYKQSFPELFSHLYVNATRYLYPDNIENNPAILD